MHDYIAEQIRQRDLLRQNHLYQESIERQEAGKANAAAEVRAVRKHEQSQWLRTVLIMLMVLAMSLGCAWQWGDTREAYADCVLENYETGLTRLFWSSQAAGKNPSSADYMKELLAGERYCTPPEPRAYKTFAEYQACNADSQELVRDKYGAESKYADVFVDEEIQAIEDRMSYLSASMCIAENSLADLPVN